MSFCGSDGCEIFDPLSFKGREGSSVPGNGGRNGYADAELRPAGGDFEKYALTYRLWGRHLFNPETSPSVWRRAQRAEFGHAADAMGQALAHASRLLPLVTTAHTPSASNHAYWPEMGVNMSLFDNPKPEPYGETKAPARFGHASPLDPELFASPDEFAEQLINNRVGAKYSPVDVAEWLENLAQSAEEHLLAAEKIADRASPTFRRAAVDVRAQLELGRFYAGKFRAALLLAIYERTHERFALEEALAAYRSARAAWARMAATTTGVYAKDLTFGEPWFQRGHWADRLTGIDEDLAAMEKLGQANDTPAPPANSAISAAPSEYVSAALAHPIYAEPQATHLPPPSLKQGEAFDLTLNLSHGMEEGTTVRLHYRHAHQAESWQVAAMAPAANSTRFETSIPRDYLKTRYPVLYYFEIVRAGRAPGLYPGLGPVLSDQPYFVVRPNPRKA